MIDVSELMDDPDFASTITVTRMAAGAYAPGGVWVAGEPVTTTETHIVQPDSNPDHTEFLPEGDRSAERAVVYSLTAVALRQADGMNQQADTFVWMGKNYRVAFSKPWDAHGYHFAIGVQYVPGRPN